MGSLRRQAWPAYFSPHQQSEPAASEPPASSSPPAFCSWLAMLIHGSKGSQNEWTVTQVALALIFQNIHNEASSRSPAAGQRQVSLTIFKTSVNKSFSRRAIPLSSVLPIVSNTETRQQKMSWLSAQPNGVQTENRKPDPSRYGERTVICIPWRNW